MNLLDAVNLILPKLGEHSVTSLTLKHPTLAVVLPEVDNELKAVLGRGWWFNEFDYTAYPDSEGGIVLGSTALTFTPKYPDTAVQRGTQLFNPSTLSYIFTDPVAGRVRQYVPFDLLPESVAQYVWYSALVNIYVTDLGVTQEVAVWQSKAAAAYSDMLAEHLRQRKYSTKSSKKWQNLRRAMRA